MSNKRNLFAFLVTSLAFAIPVFLGDGASAFSNQYPDPADTSGNANVWAYNTNTRYVQRSDGTIRVWFRTNSGSVEIRNGHFCSSNTGDYMETEDGSWGSFGDGDRITSFDPQGSGVNNPTKYGLKNPANCGAVIDFNFTGLTDTQNGYYYVDIDVTYVGNGSAGFDGVMNAFRIVAPGQANARIGLPAGGRVGDNAGHQATQEQINASPQFVNYSAVFGTPCNATGPQTATINLYDLDNAGGSGAQPPGRDVSIKVANLTDGGYVDIDPGNQTWVPNSRDNQSQSATFTARPDRKYRLEINGVYYNNTIQYSVPFSQIFFEPCEPTANLTPHATVNNSTSNITVPLGTQLNFRNWATTGNLDGVGNDTFRLRVQATQGTIPGGNWGPNDRRLSAANPIPTNRTLTSFTPTVAGRYCRQTRVSNFPSYVNAPQTTVQVCAQVGGAGGTGTVTPIAGLDATEYEVGASSKADVAYSSSFTMPAVTFSHGIALQQYEPIPQPRFAYEGRMWYDDGSGQYDGEGTDHSIYTVGSGDASLSPSPVTNSPLGTKTENSLVLEQHGNPRFRICVSMKITDAWYMMQTRSVYLVTPAAPALPYWAATAWSSPSRNSIDHSSEPAVFCATIYRYPSLQVKTGDIKVGGVFKQGLNACERTVADPNNHAIVGHAHGTFANTSRGSKGQYGVLALGSITNFGSNNFLIAQPNSDLLTFANTGPYGNFYGSTAGPAVPVSCFNETFTAYPTVETETSWDPSTPVSPIGDLNTTYRLNGSGDILKIDGGQVVAGDRRIIRVIGSGGTVLINGNISLAGVSSVYQIPQFILLVDSPDIDIKVASNVTSLSGLYVTKGSFVTCDEFNGSITSPNIHIDSPAVTPSPCYYPLTVRGAVIAGKSVIPYRTNAETSDYTQPAELIDLDGTILISDYARKQQTGNFTTIGQMELPPRF